MRPTFLSSGANVKEVLAPPSCRQTEVTLKRPCRGNGPHRITRRRAPSIAPTHSIAGDLSRVGGSGDGPEYTSPVTVVGPDVYDLDRDGDGMGCE